MKLFKKWHIVKVPRIPMLALVSYYYSKCLEENQDDTLSRQQSQDFEQGYIKCLRDLGINPKYYPKGKRG